MAAKEWCGCLVRGSHKYFMFMRTSGARRHEVRGCNSFLIVFWFDLIPVLTVWLNFCCSSNVSSAVQDQRVYWISVRLGLALGDAECTALQLSVSSPAVFANVIRQHNFYGFPNARLPLCDLICALWPHSGSAHKLNYSKRFSDSWRFSHAVAVAL